MQVSIANRNGEKERMVSGTSLRLPQRLLKLLFGEFTDVLVITPGKTVEGIEIKEIGNGVDSMANQNNPSLPMPVKVRPYLH